MNSPYPELPPQPSNDEAAGLNEQQPSALSQPHVEPASGETHVPGLAPPLGLAAFPSKIARSLLGWSDLFFLTLFYIVSGGIFLVIVSGIAMAAFHISYTRLQNSVGIQASVLIVAQALLSGATMVFLYVLVRGRTSAPFWPSVGWRTFGNVASRGATAARYLLTGFALALAVGFLSRFVGENSSPMPLEAMFRSRLSVLLMMGLGILVAPLVEETVFRGCIYPVIAGRFGISAGVLITGTIFGLMHATQLGFDWGQVSLLVFVGIILTYVRARAGTVAASYFVHLGYNSILFAGFYLATGGLRNLPGS
jgi:membrane protease YdiL (CAAX protease family)